MKFNCLKDKLDVPATPTSGYTDGNGACDAMVDLTCSKIVTGVGHCIFVFLSLLNMAVVVWGWFSVQQIICWAGGAQSFNYRMLLFVFLGWECCFGDFNITGTEHEHCNKEAMQTCRSVIHQMKASIERKDIAFQQKELFIFGLVIMNYLIMQLKRGRRYKSNSTEPWWLIFLHFYYCTSLIILWLPRSSDLFSKSESAELWEN